VKNEEVFATGGDRKLNGGGGKKATSLSLSL